MDLKMLVVGGDQERTEAEYRALFERAGLALVGVIPTGADVSLIEGVAVDVPAGEPATARSAPQA